jgi:hypothetical protein
MNIPFIKFFALMQIPSALILLSTVLDLRAKRRLIRKVTRIEESLAEMKRLHL